MPIGKLSRGVLRVLTPLGPRYFTPSFAQRIYLLWIFRNFGTLPAKVLTSRQIRLVDAVCAEEKFVAMLWQDRPLLGTLEQRPQLNLEDLPPRRPNASVAGTGSPFAGKLRQRS